MRVEKSIDRLYEDYIDEESVESIRHNLEGSDSERNFVEIGLALRGLEILCADWSVLNNLRHRLSVMYEPLYGNGILVCA